MNPDEWKRLSAPLDKLLDLTEGGRARFLHKLRAESPELCNEVESLLRQRPTARLEAPPTPSWEAASPVPRGAAPDPAESKLPEVAGYDVLGLLGRGGMGVVYRARQRALDRVVALKMIRPGAETDEHDLLRFRTEAEASARLQHPNIVQIYEVGGQDGRPYLALEYVDGGGLDRFLDGAPQPPRAAAAFVATLARAMHYAHGRGVLHRDLKPANVLLTGEAGGRPAALPAPKITDFGLAKRLQADSGQTQTGAVMGTPSYMAPEQAAGEKNVGPAADVYALGAILYEMLTGRPPFRGPSAYETLQQVRESDPAPPSRLQPKVPRDLETVCLKCLKKAPAKRYAAAGALADDLDRWLDGRPILARPAGRAERTWRWCRRNPKDAALLPAGLLAVVLGVVASIWVAGARQAAEQERRDRQARATTEAERDLADAIALEEQAKGAAVGDLVPWERAAAAAQRVKDFIDANAVENLTRRRVEQTQADVAAEKQGAENRAAATRRDAETKAAVAARDARMKAVLDELAVNQLPMTTVQGTGFIIDWPSWHDRNYERAFTDYGIDANRPDEAVAAVRASALEPDLVAALEAWIPVRENAPARRRLADLVNRLSPPDDFRREVRDALVARDHDRLGRLAKRDLSQFQPAAVVNLSLAYINAGAFEEAGALLRQARRQYPSDYLINFELAYCLGRLDPPRHDDEARFYTAAVALRPKNSLPHNSLGNALWQLGRLDEAAAEYQAANVLDPKNPYALSNLGIILFRQGKLDDAVAAYRAALALGAGPDEQAAIAHNNLGLALDEEGRTDEAVAEYRGAVALDPRYAGARYGLGWALLHRGEFRDALDAFHKDGELLPPADPRRASWRLSAQRAERLRLLGDQLEAIVEGGKKPADGAEGVDFAAVCLYKQRPAAAARLYREAFAAAPDLAERNRFEAARAAARAGVGRGEDAASTTEPQRSGWRTQARDWLRADLKGLAGKVESANAEDRQAAARPPRVWQAHADFAGVRDEAERQKLPPDEQTAWRQLWADVAALADRAEKR